MNEHQQTCRKRSNTAKQENRNIKRRNNTCTQHALSSDGAQIVTLDVQTEDVVTMGKSLYCLNKNKDIIRNPVDFITYAFQLNGYPNTIRRTKSIDNFCDPTDEQIASYDQDVIAAVRQRNMKMLRSMYYESGRSMDCCNRFGESIIHMACRRGYTDVVDFLISEAKVSLWVRDDYGRTPLHDACWAAEPNYDIIDMLLHHIPDHLLLKDERGHTPFSYVRKNDWDRWITFLSSRKSLLRMLSEEA